jgi:hypothetical protein
VLTADELCEICGATLAQRQAWSKAGDLRQRRGFEELDAAELATYSRLREVAGPRRAKAAWRTLRTPLQALLLKPRPRLWVVIETRGVERHALGTDWESLVAGVAHGRPVVVIDINAITESVRAAYRTAAAQKMKTETAQIRELRSRS